MDQNTVLHTFTVVWQKVEDAFNSFVVSHVHAPDAVSASAQVTAVQPAAQITSVTLVPPPPAPVITLPPINDSELANVQATLRAWVANSNLDNSVLLMEAAKKYLGV